MFKGKLIIALIGPLGAGKDTVAQYLVKYKGFQRFAFADTIKQAYYGASGHTEEEFKAARGTPLEEEIRKGLWAYSDSIKKEKGDSFFAMCLFQQICDSPYKQIVVTDIRTSSELNIMCAMCANIVLVLKGSEKILGSRLFYDDLSFSINSTNIFINRESSDINEREQAIEKWYTKARFT